MFDEIELRELDTNADDDLELIEDCDYSFIKSILNSDELEINYLEEIYLFRDLAKKLGVESTRKHLVPYLTHLIFSEKVAALKDLAIILGNFECYIGGPKYAHILLLPLEKLAGAKLIDVRITAIKSLQALADIMEVPDLETYFIPLITSMTLNDNYDTRWSVCHLFSTIYMRVNQKYQGVLINYHCLMSFDSFPSVREGAARSLVDLSEIVHLSIFDSKLIPRLKQFSFDQNEQVRILSLSAAISISKSFDVSYVKKIILPIVLNFINESSCKARLILVKNTTMLLKIGVSCLKLTENIMQIFIVLSKDQHLEVRLQLIDILYDCCVILYKNMVYVEANKLICKFFIPTLCKLNQDNDDRCKLAVPAAMAKLGKIIPNEVIKDHFVNLVKELLNDKNVDVVFNVIKYMREILGSQYCHFIELPEDRLICCLKALIVNGSWEMRNTGAIYLGILSTHMGHQFFEEHLEQSFLILLTDSESTVQQTVINVFKLLIEKFEMDWAQKYIVSYLVKQSFSSNTYNKITFLSFAKICATIMCTKFRTLNINMKESAVKL